MSSLATYSAPAPLQAGFPSAIGAGVFRLRFQSLFHPGRALTFPCDAKGHVTLDSLSQRALQNYLYARAVVGREFATPAVELADC